MFIDLTLKDLGMVFNLALASPSSNHFLNQFNNITLECIVYNGFFGFSSQ
jgi:hypothetical protein